MIKYSGMFKLGSGRKELKAFLGSLYCIKSMSLIQLSATPKLWRKVKQQSPCLYPILQHCHPFPSKTQQPKGLGMICLTCDYEATKGTRPIDKMNVPRASTHKEEKSQPPPCPLHTTALLASS